MTTFTARIGPWGATTCAIEDTSGAMCERPATRHLLVKVGHLRGLLNCCDACLPGLMAHRALIVDIHRFGDYCNLPNAIWVPSTPDGPGTCQLPHDLTEDIERFANQPEGALT